MPFSMDASWVLEPNKAQEALKSESGALAWLARADPEKIEASSFGGVKRCRCQGSGCIFR